MINTNNPNSRYIFHVSFIDPRELTDDLNTNDPRYADEFVEKCRHNKLVLIQYVTGNGDHHYGLLTKNGDLDEDVGKRNNMYVAVESDDLYAIQLRSTEFKPTKSFYTDLLPFLVKHKYKFVINDIDMLYNFDFIIAARLMEKRYGKDTQHNLYRDSDIADSLAKYIDHSIV